MSRWMRPSDSHSIRDSFADALLSDDEHGLAFSPEERAMLYNILRLREVRVEDVMVPRVDVDAVDETTTIAELMVLFEDSGRSRMPVYAEHLDDPRGMVHIRDLLAYITRQARSDRPTEKRVGENGEKQKPLPVELGRVDLNRSVADAGIVRKVLFVPSSMLAADLMERMQATRTQMALVIDEYGGTDGLVSLEDIVEVVVGDIEDEHDDEQQLIVPLSDDVFIVDAKAELDDLAKAVGPDFDVVEQSEDVDTIGGLIFAELGRIPARGEVVQSVPGFDIHVLDADGRRVKRVRVLRRKNGEAHRLPSPGSLARAETGEA
jgi:CBS domain containing-hemolysin-like protein